MIYQLIDYLNRFSLVAASSLCVGVTIVTTQTNLIVTALIFCTALLILCYAIITYKVVVGNVLLFVVIAISSIVFGLIIGLNSSTADNSYIDHTININAVVVGDAEYRESYQRLIVEPIGSVSKPKQNRILVLTDTYQDYRYGDVIELSGTLSPIENFIGDTGREFNYKKYLELRGVIGQVSYAAVSYTGEYQNSIRRRLAILKHHYLSVLRQQLPEPHSSLAGGITVGANDALGEETSQLFRRVGLTHIVVLSGYNVAIVIIALATVLAFLPYWVAALASFIGIWLFVFLVGATTTIIRAGVMASIAVVSRLYGSLMLPMTMLALAVVAMVVHQPLIVAYDPSFQLSVLATVGIIVVTPIIEPYFGKIPNIGALREIVVTTLATQLTVIPWIVFLMGEFSIVSPLANVLVLPIIPWAMAGSFLIYVLSPLSMLFTKLLSYVTFLLLDHVFVISDSLGSKAHNWLSNRTQKIR